MFEATKDGLLTQEQAGGRLGVSLSTVIRLIKSGKLTATRIGSRIRITEASLSRLLESESQGGAA